MGFKTPRSIDNVFRFSFYQLVQLLNDSMTTILICEDDIALASYWRHLLEAEDHIVYCCETAVKALELLKTTSPDLVITDMMIKENGKFVAKGGITLVNKLRQKTQPSIPVICVSGYRPNRYNVIPALELVKTMGVDMALYKPISPKKLLNAVTSLL